MNGSRSKIPSKKSRQERCAEGFNSGLKGLKKAEFSASKIKLQVLSHYSILNFF
jgi:hypothetical protein